jgi:hypothetical protein
MEHAFPTVFGTRVGGGRFPAPPGDVLPACRATFEQLQTQTLELLQQQ